MNNFADNSYKIFIYSSVYTKIGHLKKENGRENGESLKLKIIRDTAHSQMALNSIEPLWLN